MDCPPGMTEVGLGDVNHTKDALLLLQSIYGTVQSARQYFKKLVSMAVKLILAYFGGSQAKACVTLPYMLMTIY